MEMTCRCQETLETHNKNAREILRSELEAEFQLKFSRVEAECGAELEKLRSANKPIYQMFSVRVLLVAVNSVINPPSLLE